MDNGSSTFTLIDYDVNDEATAKVFLNNFKDYMITFYRMVELYGLSNVNNINFQIFRRCPFHSVMPMKAATLLFAIAMIEGKVKANKKKQTLFQLVSELTTKVDKRINKHFTFKDNETTKQLKIDIRNTILERHTLLYTQTSWCTNALLKLNDTTNYITNTIENTFNTVSTNYALNDDDHDFKFNVVYETIQNDISVSSTPELYSVTLELVDILYLQRIKKKTSNESITGSHVQTNITSKTDDLDTYSDSDSDVDSENIQQQMPFNPNFEQQQRQAQEGIVKSNLVKDLSVRITGIINNNDIIDKDNVILGHLNEFSRNVEKTEKQLAIVHKSQFEGLLNTLQRKNLKKSEEKVRLIINTQIRTKEQGMSGGNSLRWKWNLLLMGQGLLIVVASTFLSV